MVCLQQSSHPKHAPKVDPTDIRIIKNSLLNLFVCLSRHEAHCFSRSVGVTSSCWTTLAVNYSFCDYFSKKGQETISIRIVFLRDGWSFHALFIIPCKVCVYETKLYSLLSSVLCPALDIPGEYLASGPEKQKYSKSLPTGYVHCQKCSPSPCQLVTSLLFDLCPLLKRLAYSGGRMGPPIPQSTALHTLLLSSRSTVKTLLKYPITTLSLASRITPWTRYFYAVFSKDSISQYCGDPPIRVNVNIYIMVRKPKGEMTF